MKNPNPKFKVGESVSLAKWDALNSPDKRLGICEIAKVILEKHSHSGIMYKFKGYPNELDQTWFSNLTTLHSSASIVDSQ